MEKKGMTEEEERKRMGPHISGGGGSGKSSSMMTVAEPEKRRGALSEGDVQYLARLFEQKNLGRLREVTKKEFALKAAEGLTVPLMRDVKDKIKGFRFGKIDRNTDKEDFAAKATAAASAMLAPALVATHALPS